MRQVLSLSLSANVVDDIKHRVDSRGFQSVSDYIKYLITMDDDLTSEAELLKTVKQSRIEYGRGQSIKANSIKDLL